MTRRSVISIGNFDGVHVGHQAIVRRARHLAAADDARVVVLTFDPHPANVLRPGSAPPRLCTLEQKLRWLGEAGADDVVVLEPTDDLLGQAPEQFVAGLVERYGPTAIVEGEDFRFGKDRQGDVALLRRLGQQHGFDVQVQPAVAVRLSTCYEAPVSSTLVRRLVGHGQVLDAARCLGRPFEMRGLIVRGDRRGRDLNMPTANLDPQAYVDQIVPADGIYAGEAIIASADDSPQPNRGAGEGVRYPAAISVGSKPTFGEHPLAVEAHLLDFAGGELYGRHLTLRFARWLRDQYAFGSLDPLVQQMQRDVRQVRQWAARRASVSIAATRASQ